jgi:hypothetical protein
MASIVATPDPTTGSVLLQLNRQLVIDNFNRVVAGGWGSASLIGGAYTTGGADFSVNGTVGIMTLNSLGAAYRARISSGLTDVDATLRSALLVNPTGAPIDTGIMLRYTDPAETYYLARVRLSPGGVPATLSIQHVSGATRTPLTAEVPVGFNVSGTNDFNIRFTASGNLLRARVWRGAIGEAEPETWLVEARDTSYTSGSVGVHAWRNSGNTNAAPEVRTEDFTVLASVAPLNLWRHTPDGTATLVRGSGFFTDTFTGTAVVWDNEAPFDTNIFYTLRSADSVTDTVTSNTVSLASGGDVWLRDPYNPSNNLVIEISDVPFDYCNDDPRIMFADLQSKVYESASGIFDLIDAQRPETIAQTRKRYGSTLYLTSKEAADVDAIEAIIAGGYPLRLSLPVVYQFGLPYGTDWVTFLAVQSDPPGTDRRLPTRNWVMPFRLSLPPSDVDTGSTGGSGIGGGGATFDNLAASVIGLTFNSLTAAGQTFDSIAAGTGY